MKQKRPKKWAFRKALSKLRKVIRRMRKPADRGYRPLFFVEMNEMLLKSDRVRAIVRNRYAKIIDSRRAKKKATKL